MLATGTESILSRLIFLFLNPLFFLVRIIVILFVSFIALCLCVCRRYLTSCRSDRLVKLWALSVIYLLGINLKSFGSTDIAAGTFITSNHRSYIDILIVLALFDPIFLAKEEVSHWPIIGRLAMNSNTVFVRRNCKQSRRLARQRLTELLVLKNTVMVFSEGTTSMAPALREYYPGMFYSAASYGVPIVALSIEYDQRKMAWVESDSLISHLLRTFGLRNYRVNVHVSSPELSGDGAHLKNMSEQWARQYIL